MQINLKSAPLEGEFKLSLSTRLPDYIEEPCDLFCKYRIQVATDYYILTYSVQTSDAHPLSVSCQRCMEAFSCPYSNTVTLAICNSEEQAVRLMDDYECFVSENNQVDFTELLTDDLYLYVPVNHPDSGDCDPQINQFLR